MKNFDSIIKDIRKVTGTSNSQIPLPLHEPYLKKTDAISIVSKCINSSWVSTRGEWVEKFEKKICLITKAKYAVAVSNGTDGLRMALHVCGVKPDEEVILPSLTFVATANCIAHLGAIPHFVDIETRTFGLCPKQLDNYLKNNILMKNGIAINKNTNRVIRAIIPVHLFGVPANIFEITKIARKWNLKIVEDAAEALGSHANKTHCGLIGDVGVISFNGNKIITCGGGGIIITNSKYLATKSRHLSTTAKVNDQYELKHDHIAWNDRLPSINAALGYSQLEIFETIIEKKRKLANRYHELFSNKYPFSFIKEKDKDNSNYWLNTIQIDPKKVSEIYAFRNNLLSECKLANIYLRPIWQPLHTLKIFKNCPRSEMKNTLNYSKLLISFPSSPHFIDD